MLSLSVEVVVVVVVGVVVVAGVVVVEVDVELLLIIGLFPLSFDTKIGIRIAADRSKIPIRAKTTINPVLLFDKGTSWGIDWSFSFIYCEEALLACLHYFEN